MRKLVERGREMESGKTRKREVNWEKEGSEIEIGRKKEGDGNL